MIANIEQLRKADWHQMEIDVVRRIRLLHKMADHLEPGPINDKIADELILPNLRLLAAFCEAVEIEDKPREEDDDDQTREHGRRPLVG